MGRWFRASATFVDRRGGVSFRAAGERVGLRVPTIAERLGTGHTPAAVQQHWHTRTKQNGDAEALWKAPRWTAEEESRLRQLVSELVASQKKSAVSSGHFWPTIAERLGTGRTPAAVQQHWNEMRRRQPSLQRLDSGGSGTNLFVSHPSLPNAAPSLLKVLNAAPSLQRLDSGDVRINFASGVSPRVVEPLKRLDGATDHGMPSSSSFTGGGGAPGRRRRSPHGPRGGISPRQLVDELGATASKETIAARLGTGRTPAAYQEHWRIMHAPPTKPAWTAAGSLASCSS